MIHLATSDEIPRLQSVIMSHFLFEYVHPFYDATAEPAGISWPCT